MLLKYDKKKKTVIILIYQNNNKCHKKGYFLMKYRFIAELMYMTTSLVEL